MRKPIIKKGDRYGKLTAIIFVKKKNSIQYWLFKCDCGNEKVILVSNVSRGFVKSCGCLQKENRIKHGMFGTRTYRSWDAMKQRCLNPNNIAYRYYGERGITICEEWLIFQNFYRDMGERPVGKTLDRIKNDKGYYKKNCKWSTPKEQANNTRSNLLNK